LGENAGPKILQLAVLPLASCGEKPTQKTKPFHLTRENQQGMSIHVGQVVKNSAFDNKDVG